MERVGQRANATPSLPGQDANNGASPAITQTFPVVAHA
jgi:hypothetical protein